MIICAGKTSQITLSVYQPEGKLQILNYEILHIPRKLVSVYLYF